MANLLGQNIGTNYKGILSLDSTINTPLDATLRAVTDGEGNASPLQLSTTAISLGGATGANWDNTNRRLSIGTNNALSRSFRVVGQSLLGDVLFGYRSTAQIANLYGSVSMTVAGIGIGISEINESLSALARLHIKGSGTTASTTALLVQNSAGTETFKVQDNGKVVLGGLTFENTIINGSPYFASAPYGPNWRIQTSGATTFGASSPSDASSILDLRSTTKGFLPPRMTTTEKNAIAAPASGLVVYDNVLDRQSVYTTAWQNSINESSVSPNPVADIWSGTQAEYNALTPIATTLYFIV